MSPIDDELRSMFTSRADVLVPTADPLAGIERRAKRIRRNRIAASVAGTALAVSAVAVAVPALMPERDSGSRVVIPANSGEPTQQASDQPTPVSSTSPGAELDPQHPWAYRGSQAVLRNGNLDTIRREWATRHPGSTLSPLFGQVYEPSQQSEVVFVATGRGGDRWGVVTSSEAGPEFVTDEALAAGTKVLMTTLAGDEVPRLLVVAAPTTGDIGYAANGTTFTSLPMPAPGVAFRGLEGDTSRDAVRVLDGDGDESAPVFLGPAPDAAAPSDGTDTPATVTAPPETTSSPTLAARYAFVPSRPWAYRGPTEVGDVVAADSRQFTTEHGEGPWTDTPLFVRSSSTDVGVVLHTGSDGSWVSFTAVDKAGTHQVAYQPSSGEDVLSAYIPLSAQDGLLVAVVSDKAANVVLQTGDRAEVGSSRTAGIWDWAPKADPQARLAAFAAGDAEPYASQLAS